MATKESQRYIEAVGRRKTAVARVRITPGTKQDVTVNGRALAEHFPTTIQQATVNQPFTSLELTDTFGVSAYVLGGGQEAQAEAIRHGIARSLVKYDPELRKTLKDEGYLKRDPRAKERKKFGLRKARRRPQWSKR